MNFDGRGGLYHGGGEASSFGDHSLSTSGVAPSIDARRSLLFTWCRSGLGRVAPMAELVDASDSKCALSFKETIDFTVFYAILKHYTDALFDYTVLLPRTS